MPVDVASYEKLCTKSMFRAVIMAVLVGLRPRQHGETTWVYTVSLDTSVVDHDCFVEKFYDQSLS